jgi:Domain of unknown function (DUF4200)
MLEADAVRFDLFLRESEAAVNEAIRAADGEAKRRSEKQVEIKRLSGRIAVARSELGKQVCGPPALPSGRRTRSAALEEEVEHHAQGGGLKVLAAGCSLGRVMVESNFAVACRGAEPSLH